MNDVLPPIVHTPRDLARFEAQGIDPDTRQARERAAACVVCRRETWNLSARCDLHEEQS